MSVLTKIIELFTGTPDVLGRQVHVTTERDLMREENEIGKQLFDNMRQGVLFDWYRNIVC